MAKAGSDKILERGNIYFLYRPKVQKKHAIVERETYSSADIFTELKLDRKKHPTTPLFRGKWE